MKSSRYWKITLGLVLLLLAIGLLLFREKSKPEVANEAQQSQPTGLEEDESRAATVRSKADGLFPNKQPDGISQAGRPEKDKEETKREGLSILNDVEISFYGKLEDEASNPLADTDIQFSIQYDNGLRSGVTNGTTRSNAGGRFSISRYKGERLSIRPIREGYALIGTNAGAIYSHMWPEGERHHPDPNDPVVIRMWKLRGAEQLVKLEKRITFSANQENWIDLTTGRKVDDRQNADLNVILNKESSSVPKRGAHDWSVTLKPIDGGIMEVSLPEYQYTFLAPDSGYEQIFEVYMRTNNPDWFDNFTRLFFIQSRNGC